MAVCARKKRSPAWTGTRPDIRHFTRMSIHEREQKWSSASDLLAVCGRTQETVWQIATFDWPQGRKGYGHPFRRCQWQPILQMRRADPTLPAASMILEGGTMGTKDPGPGDARTAPKLRIQYGCAAYCGTRCDPLQARAPRAPSTTLRGLFPPINHMTSLSCG